MRWIPRKALIGVPHVEITDSALDFRQQAEGQIGVLDSRQRHGRQESVARALANIAVRRDRLHGECEGGDLWSLYIVAFRRQFVFVVSERDGRELGKRKGFR